MLAMEFISLNRIMDRLLVNPALKSLGYSTAAAYVKDFASINGLQPVLGYYLTYVKTSDYKAELPTNVVDVKDVYSCSNLDSQWFEDNRLGAALSDSIVRSKDKVSYKAYTVKDNILFTDQKEDQVLEVGYTAIRVDEEGFPTLPYDGSLMMAVTNFIKWQYYDMLGDCDANTINASKRAEQQYAWYIAQYQSKNIVPTYDEAVSWVNSWQRLLDTRNQDMNSKHIRQGNMRNTSSNGYQDINGNARNNSL